MSFSRIKSSNLFTLENDNFFNKKHATNKLLETSVNNTSTSSQIELNLDSISSQNENVNMIQGHLKQCEKLDDDEDEIIDKTKIRGR